MPKLTEEQAEQVVAAWRSGRPIEGWENPAGPLFASGEYAEADITMEAIFAATGCTGAGCPPPGTAICGTACTYSAGRQCC